MATEQGATAITAISALEESQIETNNFTIPIVQPRDQATVETLTKIRGLPQADVLAGEELPGAPVDGVDGQQSLTVNGRGQQPAAGATSGEQRGPAGGMTSNSGWALPPRQVTPAVTTSISWAAWALLSTATLYKLQ